MNKLIICAVAVMTLAACNKEEGINLANYPSDNVVRIAPATRGLATPNLVDFAGNELSLTVQYVPTNIYDAPDVKWTATTTDGVKSWTSEKMIRWKNASATANVWAVYPYMKVNQTGSYDFTIQSDQSQGYAGSDVMFFINEAFKPYDNLNAKKAVDITFNHLLSKLTILPKFSNQAGTPAPTITQIRVMNTYTAGNFVPMTGTMVNPAEQPNKAIKMYKNGDGNYEAILLPSAIYETYISITLSNGEEYRYAPNNGITLEQGKKYEMNLTIGHDAITLTSPVQVNDWPAEEFLPQGYAEI